MQKRLAAAAALALVSLAAPAFSADKATATASVNIMAPIAVTAGQPLVFGEVLAGSGGAIIVSPHDTRSKSGGVTLLWGTSPMAAHFHVSADTTDGAAYAVSYSKTDLSGPGPALGLSAITASVAPTADGADIKVGATLTIASGQAAGAYSGSVTATTTYD